MARDPLDVARSIGDRFVAWQGPSGRPDPQNCPFASKGKFYPTVGQSPPFIARALYRLFDRTGDVRYKDSADRYAIFSFSYARDPVPPWDDRQRDLWVQDALQHHPERLIDPGKGINFVARSWIYGAALDPAWREFRRHNPAEDCYDARADSLFDWMQRHRTDRGHAYNIGYPPLGADSLGIADAAYTDDLRLAGTGLVGYYELTKRQDALDAALRLSDFYLRAHKPGTADGSFVESLGTWCIGPWPITISVEHFDSVRLDQVGWGFSARGAVEYLARLHACLPPDHPRAQLMRARCVRSVQWQFSCQFDDGAIGMHTQDDHWLGMNAAALLAYDDLRTIGWVDDTLAGSLEPNVSRARRWLLDNATEEMIEQGGYRRSTGRTNTFPPENLAWLLAWTVEALLRLEDL